MLGSCLCPLYEGVLDLSLGGTWVGCGCSSPASPSLFRPCPQLGTRRYRRFSPQYGRASHPTSPQRASGGSRLSAETQLDTRPLLPLSRLVPALRWPLGAGGCHKGDPCSTASSPACSALFHLFLPRLSRHIAASAQQCGFRPVRRLLGCCYPTALLPRGDSRCCLLSRRLRAASHPALGSSGARLSSSRFLPASVPLRPLALALACCLPVGNPNPGGSQLAASEHSPYLPFPTLPSLYNTRLTRTLSHTPLHTHRLYATPFLASLLASVSVRDSDLAFLRVHLRRLSLRRCETSDAYREAILGE